MKCIAVVLRKYIIIGVDIIILIIIIIARNVNAVTIEITELFLNIYV